MAGMTRNFVFSVTKGTRGRSNNNYKLAVLRAEKSLKYAYIDRRNKKRDIRGLWIQQIGAATKGFGVSYSQFIHGLNQANVALNRKMLAEIAVNEPFSFMSLVNEVKEKFSLPDRNRKKMNEEDYQILADPVLPEEFRVAPPSPGDLGFPLLHERFAKAQAKADEVNEENIKAGKVILPKVEPKKYRRGKRKTPGYRVPVKKDRAAEKERRKAKKKEKKPSTSQPKRI
uniref:50S ribosomal protein L20 n=1 Tax=Arcella intermedia TaxID=1963864 RepID=A0A6B2LGY7_9EUKA|eukprot:TRINITY_DN23383_c0_g1_i1.p1 TRINITY_DN23383_c0_g1~~TRINITY_DN23383_c0_g1_i1.p1  ORF type:complete len:228 (+),score=62.86 TRINITY_DN23383_c0_g1_i1:24-707(+)